MNAQIPYTRWKVTECPRSRTIQVVPEPNDEGHSERRCFCRPRIEIYPDWDLVIHNHVKVGRA